MSLAVMQQASLIMSLPMQGRRSTRESEASCLANLNDVLVALGLHLVVLLVLVRLLARGEAKLREHQRVLVGFVCTLYWCQEPCFSCPSRG